MIRTILLFLLALPISTHAATLNDRAFELEKTAVMLTNYCPAHAASLMQAAEYLASLHGKTGQEAQAEIQAAKDFFATDKQEKVDLKHFKAASKADKAKRCDMAISVFASWAAALDQEYKANTL